MVDVALDLDLAPRPRSDDVADTVHYGELAERLAAIVAGEPVNLIETLAERLAAACLADQRVAGRHGHRAQAAGADPARVRRRRGHASTRRRWPMTRAVLSLGSNLGDRFAHLRTAVAALRDVLLAVSGVYETPPWGDPDQPAYLNAVLLVRGRRRDPRRTGSTRARAIEDAAGRVRDPRRRFGPRSLDVDVIAVWDDDGEPVRQRGSGADPAAPAGAPARVRAAPVDRPRSRTGSSPATAGVDRPAHRRAVADDVAGACAPGPDLPLESDVVSVRKIGFGGAAG